MIRRRLGLVGWRWAKPSSFPLATPPPLPTSSTGIAPPEFTIGAAMEVGRGLTPPRHFPTPAHPLGVHAGRRPIRRRSDSDSIAPHPIVECGERSRVCGSPAQPCEAVAARPSRRRGGRRDGRQTHAGSSWREERECARGVRRSPRSAARARALLHHRRRLGSPDSGNPAPTLSLADCGPAHASVLTSLVRADAGGGEMALLPVVLTTLRADSWPSSGDRGRMRTQSSESV